MIWTLASYFFFFYNVLIEKSCQVLNVLSKESFVEMQPTKTMMVFNNLITGENNVATYGEINETKNFDVNYLWRD